MTLPSLSPAQTHPTHQEGFSFFGNPFEDCRAISKRLRSSGLIDPSRRISLTSITAPPTSARKPSSARIRRYAKPTTVLIIKHSTPHASSGHAQPSLKDLCLSKKVAYDFLAIQQRADVKSR